jgi:hypothetical protein
MTSEQNVPEVQSYQGSPASSQEGDAQYNGQPVPHGMGQSKSSRRRRRKRKTKVTGEGAGQQGFESQPQPGQVPSVQAAAPPQQQFQPQGGQQNFHGGQNSSGGKRWKKKYRERDRDRRHQSPGNAGEGGYRGSDSHQPGNSAYSGGKKNKQRSGGSRSFVGPMDHSYREVNGNFADGPPSTIDTGNYGRRNGNGRTFVSDTGPIDYSVGRPIPVDENAPTKIYFFIEDLFFLAKIQETARKLGVKVAFVKNDKEVISHLTKGEDEDRPGLIVFDLNNANAKPLTLIPKLKAKLKKGTSIIGFLSHLQGDLKAKATEAGCDTVMPRAAFSQNLPNLLRRYGTAEEEEANFNQ